jgi:predicted ATPase
MARFLATLAAGGVQVIIETHSDHIINGIRLAAIDDHPLDRQKVIIHNLYTDSEGSIQVDPIEITATGSLSKWPANFLDQTERDLAAILRAREKHG